MEERSKQFTLQVRLAIISDTTSSASDNMARTSTFFPFSLLELAKARVFTYQLDTTDHLNPGLSISKDLEALRMLEGTYVVTSLQK